MESECEVGEASEITRRILSEKLQGCDGCFPWAGKADGGAWFSLVDQLFILLGSTSGAPLRTGSVQRMRVRGQMKRPWKGVKRKVCQSLPFPGSLASLASFLDARNSQSIPPSSSCSHEPSS